ncbi:proline-rich protein 29 isoform X2 [Erythrolamprus reginae]|uniref:proline-rich protein 29 isoform X2 n=1 Tax=Erythrolamprus reginae TaxID=121349 RepID=UPI00396CF7D4
MNPGGNCAVSPQVYLVQQPITQEPEVTILQQMPWTPPQSSSTSHIKENLIDLMMIQNAQMHQVIMNNMAMSAAACFESNPNQIPLIPSQTEDEDEIDMVFHHYYVPYPCTLPFRTWKPPSRSSGVTQQQPTIRHVGPDLQSTGRKHDGQVVPPPPPPSATGTVTADVLPASEYYDYTERLK